MTSHIKKTIQYATAVFFLSAILSGYAKGASYSVFGADCPLTPGKSYKLRNSPGVYYITSDCKKQAIRNPSIFFSYFTSWRDVNITTLINLDRVPKHPLSFLPWGGRHQLGNGTLVKTVDDPKVYVKLATGLYPIETADVFTGLGYEWNWVEDISPELLAKYSIQSTIRSNAEYPPGLHFKYVGTPEVYSLERQTNSETSKRYIRTMEELRVGYRADRLAVLSQTVRYPLAPGSSEPPIRGAQESSDVRSTQPLQLSEREKQSGSGGGGGGSGQLNQNQSSEYPLSDSSNQSQQPISNRNQSSSGTSAPAILQSPIISSSVTKSSMIGINLHDLNYYAGNWPFVDAFKQGASWHSGVLYGAWSDGRTLDKDAYGWVKSLLQNQVARVYVIGNNAEGHPFPVPAGDYTILYEGDGDFDIQGVASTVSREPGKIVVRLNSNSSLIVNLIRTNPQNYVRNVRVIMPGGSCTNDVFAWCTSNSQCASGGTCQLFTETYATRPFHPVFLSELRPFNTVRFLKWMEIERVRSNAKNGVSDDVSITTWNEHPSAHTSSWKPVPWSVMIDLANTLDADPWFTIPHKADDDYVRQAAMLVRDRLESGRKAYVEYSNETWNAIYSHADWMNAKGCERYSNTARTECDRDGDGILCEYDGLLPNGNAPWDSYQQNCVNYGRRYYSTRTVEIMRIFEDILGSNYRNRLVRVMGSQISAGNGFTPSLMTNVWNGSEQAYRHIDVLAVAPYFGGSYSVNSVDEAFEQNAGPLRGGAPGLYTVLTGRVSNSGGPLSWMQTDYAYTRSVPGLKLVAYEGGQHFQSYDNTMRERFRAVNEDPRMKELYIQYLNLWREITGGSLFVHFVAPGAPGNHGTFGIKKYQGQLRAEAPKYDALMTFIEQESQPRPASLLESTQSQTQTQTHTQAQTQTSTQTQTGTGSQSSGSESSSTQTEESGSSNSSSSESSHTQTNELSTPPELSAATIVLTLSGSGHAVWTGHNTSKIHKLIFSKIQNPTYSQSPIHYERSGGQSDAWVNRADLVRLQPTEGWNTGAVYIRVCEYISSVANDCASDRYSNTVTLD